MAVTSRIRIRLPRRCLEREKIVVSEKVKTLQDQSENHTRMSARARFLQSLPDRPPGGLNPSEIYWRDHQPWLASRGYMLRPRYSPNWVPSWEGTDKIWAECEDGHGLN